MIFSHLWLEISVNFGDFMSQVTFFDCSLSTRSLLSVFYTGHEMSIPMANGPIQLQFSPRFTNRKFPFLFVPDHWAAFLSLSMSKILKSKWGLTQHYIEGRKKVEGKIHFLERLHYRFPNCYFRSMKMSKNNSFTSFRGRETNDGSLVLLRKLQKVAIYKKRSI